MAAYVIGQSSVLVNRVRGCPLIGVKIIIIKPHYEKTGFGICEHKDADQLRSNCATDQCLCFHYTDRKMSLIPKSEISSLCVCTARFMSDLVGNPEDPFSHNESCKLVKIH